MTYCYPHLKPKGFVLWLKILGQAECSDNLLLIQIQPRFLLALFKNHQWKLLETELLFA